jgi:acyl-CoA thioesterase
VKDPRSVDESERDRFERDTQVQGTSSGVYRARLDRGWWILNGPNGGYLAAIVLRALTDAVGDPQRHVRSLTLHYLRPPGEGDAEVHTRIERQGRTLTTVSADLVQGGRLITKALGAFATRRDAPSFTDLIPPDLPPPERCPSLRDRFARVVEMQHRYDIRWASGIPGDGPGDRAECVGWFRLAHPRVADAPLVAAMTDAFPPAVFLRNVGGRSLGPVPTIDLTIHFRQELPLPGATADDCYALRFRTAVASGGFVEEDGEVWTRDGRLVAQSRQLALIG